MKKLFFISVLTVVVKLSVFAQWVDVWPNNDAIQGSCYATGKDTAFLTSDGGKIYRTVNGGVTWEGVQTLFTESWFNDLFFPSKNIGYACGGTAFGSHTSCVAKTIDGGQTWDSLTSNEFGYEFTSLFFVNDTLGYFVGESFVKTTDGGKTFSKIPIPFSTNQVAPTLQAVYFLDSNTGLVSTREYINATKTRYRIARTTNGGLSWTTAHIDSSVSDGAAKNIHAITFKDALNGYAVGPNGTLLITADGGVTWMKSSIINDSTHLSDIGFSPDPLIGYMVGWKSNGSSTEGRIYQTIDGGLTWNIDFYMPSDRFISISVPAKGVGYSKSVKNVYMKTSAGVGIDDLSNDLDLILYPNPVEDVLYIKTPHSTEHCIEVYNVFGQIVHYFLASERETKVDLSSSPNGIYIVSVTAGENKAARRIIKK